MTAMVLLSQWQASQVEFWMPIKGIVGYDISSFGRVRSYRGTKRGKGKIGKGNRAGFTSVLNETPQILPSRIMLSRNKPSYPVVALQFPDKEKNRMIHRLVAQAFHPNPQELPQVNHLNLVKTDARADNLQWITHFDNHLHMDACGMRPKGTTHYAALLNADQVREIRRLYEADHIGTTTIGRMFGITKHTAWRVAKRQSYREVE